jgi:prevent-host-death family protein
MTKSRKGARTRTRAVEEAAPAPYGQGAVPTITIPSTEAQNEFGRILDQAAADQDIAITRHNVVRAVLVSAARYRQLVAHEESGSDVLASRFDELYAGMQKDDVRKATSRAINVSPEEMGRAAIAAARRSQRRRKRE